ncbi:hypothetical protein BJ165DRAFT_1464423 [Panaeolus papilionaceus]|nr:hypothetical protein BJ165DRAFT_1464423 [Panaeolus papilionaceus]
MDSKTEPILSVELFQLIIGEIATYPSSFHPRHLISISIGSRLGALTRCALVCKRFAQMCRPHIFEHIHSVGLVDDGKKRLLCLVENSMTGQAGLRQLVRKLTFDASSSSWYGTGSLQLEDSQLPLVIATLSSFPKLRDLVIYRTGVGFYSSQHDILHPIYANLVQTYLKQGTLRTLCLDVLPITISLGDILSSPFLSYLSLTHLDARSLTTLDRAVTSNITQLSLANYQGDHFPLAFLDHCPHLEAIEFYNLHPLIASPLHPDSKNAFDPSKLKVLILTDVTPFIRFCELRAPRDYRKIFQDLEGLDVWLTKESYIGSLCDMLMATVSLQRVYIDASECPSQFHIPTLELDERFKDGTLGSLTHLSLFVTSLHGPEGYKTSLEDIHSIFLAASQRNSIQAVYIQLTIALEGLEVDMDSLIDHPSRYFSPLAATLASRVGYPTLKEVNFSISFEPSNETAFHASIADSEASLSKILKRGMKALGERDGVRFVENVIYPRSFKK